MKTTKIWFLAFSRRRPRLYGRVQDRGEKSLGHGLHHPHRRSILPGSIHSVRNRHENERRFPAACNVARQTRSRSHRHQNGRTEEKPQKQKGEKSNLRRRRRRNGRGESRTASSVRLAGASVAVAGHGDRVGSAERE
jgi:hypothetical protein